MKNNRKVKIISNGLCDDDTINEFNRRIAEIIAMKYPKNIIKEIISEYEKRK